MIWADAISGGEILQTVGFFETDRDGFADVLSILLAGALLLAVGYAISSITAAFVRPLFGFESPRRSNDGWIGLGRAYSIMGFDARFKTHFPAKSPLEWTPDKAAMAVIRMAIFPEPISGWLDRRANAMWVAWNCIVALVCALLVAFFLMINGRSYWQWHQGFLWLAIWIFLFTTVVMNARLATRDIQRMTEFCLACESLSLRNIKCGCSCSGGEEPPQEPLPPTS